MRIKSKRNQAEEINSFIQSKKEIPTTPNQWQISMNEWMNKRANKMFMTKKREKEENEKRTNSHTIDIQIFIMQKHNTDWYSNFIKKYIHIFTIKLSSTHHKIYWIHLLGQPQQPRQKKKKTILSKIVVNKMNIVWPKNHTHTHYSPPPHCVSVWNFFHMKFHRNKQVLNKVYTSTSTYIIYIFFFVKMKWECLYYSNKHIIVK